MKYKNITTLALVLLWGAMAAAQSATEIPESAQIKPEELVKIVQSSSQKPLILMVGPRLMFAQAHIPGAEYTGAASTPEGISQLHKRVEKVQRTKGILIYCGCCPWHKCPNVAPAYKELTTMGFKNVRVLAIPDNFGTDWVKKGYPTQTGQ